MSLWKYVQAMSIGLLLVLSCAAAAMAQGPAATSALGPNEVGVSLDESIQKDFLGVNAVYHGVAFTPEQVRKGMDDADRKREFDRVATMKLNIARTWYGPEMVYSDEPWRRECDTVLGREEGRERRCQGRFSLRRPASTRRHDEWRLPLARRAG
jgi:hypothetical protein